MTAISLLNGGLLPHEVARRLDVNRRTVRKWKSLYRRRGKPALRARPVSGRPLKLAATTRERLRRLLIKGAGACGFETDLWTCPRVARVIRREYGVDYHPDHIGRLLHGLGFTPQKAMRQARERDEKGVRKWMRTTWEATKKKPAD